MRFVKEYARWIIKETRANPFMKETYKIQIETRIRSLVRLYENGAISTYECMAALSETNKDEDRSPKK